MGSRALRLSQVEHVQRRITAHHSGSCAGLLFGGFSGVGVLFGALRPLGRRGGGGGLRRAAKAAGLGICLGRAAPRRTQSPLSPCQGASPPIERGTAPQAERWTTAAAGNRRERRDRDGKAGHAQCLGELLAAQQCVGLQIVYVDGRPCANDAGERDTGGLRKITTQIGGHVEGCSALYANARSLPSYA